MWLRIFQHLLPQAQAWRITVTKMLRSFFLGLTGLPTAVRQFVDDVHDDLYPSSTRQLASWETQFGLTPSAGATDAVRRSNLAGAWQAQGGQSPSYLQSVVQAAGFPLYIHEWWDPTALPTITARDPRTYTHQPKIGTVRCVKLDGSSGPPFRCRPTPQMDPTFGADAWRCNRWLNNETKYFVNLNLTRDAPPPIPSDPATWPFFLMWCGSTYGTVVNIPAARRNELEALLKKLCPAQDWLIVLADYV